MKGDGRETKRTVGDTNTLDTGQQALQALAVHLKEEWNLEQWTDQLGCCLALMKC